MTDEIEIARLRDEASNLRILIARQEAEAEREENAPRDQPSLPRVDVEAMRKRLIAIEQQLHEHSRTDASSDDPRAELMALEEERAELTARMHRSEDEWAERVRAEGEASAAERSELHYIRNRLQMIQAMTFRLRRQLGSED